MEVHELKILPEYFKAQKAGITLIAHDLIKMVNQWSIRKENKMTNNSNKTLTGQRLSFNAALKNFKADGDAVTITLIADAKQLDLNTLNKISLNSLTVDFTSVQTELLAEPKKAEDK